MEEYAITGQPTYYQPQGAVSFSQFPSSHSVHVQSTVYPPQGLNALEMINRMFIRQLMEPMEVLSGHQTNNKYDVLNANGHIIFRALENTTEFAKLCCGSSRTLNFQVYDLHGREIMHLSRPYTCFSSGTLNITLPPGCNGEKIGTVEKHCCVSNFSVKNGSGQRILQIEGPMCCTQPCCCGTITFKIFNGDRTQKIGKITRERVDAGDFHASGDCFDVSYPVELDINTKASLIGTTILIDLLYYEQEPGHKHGRNTAELHT